MCKNKCINDIIITAANRSNHPIRSQGYPLILQEKKARKSSQKASLEIFSSVQSKCSRNSAVTFVEAEWIEL